MYLVDSWPDFDVRDVRLNLLGTKVADTDALDKAFLHQLLQGLPGLQKGGLHCRAGLL